MNIEIVGKGVSITSSMKEVITRKLEAVSLSLSPAARVKVRVSCPPKKKEASRVSISTTLLGRTLSVEESFKRSRDGSTFLGAFESAAHKFSENIHETATRARGNLRQRSRASV